MAYTESEKDFFKKRYTGTIAFAVGVLLFLMPFVELKCNAIPLAEATGLDLISGKISNEKTKENAIDGKNYQVDGRFEIQRKKLEKTDPFALAAFLMGLGGFIFSFLNFRNRPLAAMMLATAAAISLLVMMIRIKSKIDTTIESLPDSEGDILHIRADFTIWYYLCFFSFVAAAIFSWFHIKLQKAKDMPPDKAPQIKIENPGEQSEFPGSPSESDLG